MLTQEERDKLSKYITHMSMAKQTFTIPNISKSEKKMIYDLYVSKYGSDGIKSPECYQCMIKIFKQLYTDYNEPIIEKDGSEEDL